jgi:hypothetical protein
MCADKRVDVVLIVRNKRVSGFQRREKAQCAIPNHNQRVNTGIPAAKRIMLITEPNESSCSVL